VYFSGLQYVSLRHVLRNSANNTSPICLVLQCVLQCVAVFCSVLQCAAVSGSVLQCVAVCCSVLQCVAVRDSVLQWAAVCCNVLQCAHTYTHTHTHTHTYIHKNLLTRNLLRARVIVRSPEIWGGYN